MYYIFSLIQLRELDRIGVHLLPQKAIKESSRSQFEWIKCLVVAVAPSIKVRRRARNVLYCDEPEITVKEDMFLIASPPFLLQGFLTLPTAYVTGNPVECVLHPRLWNTTEIWDPLGVGQMYHDEYEEENIGYQIGTVSGCSLYQ